MQSVKKTVSIIIPNYNGRALLEAYLPHTIAVADDADITYEIIIVDDASKDDSVSFIAENYPQVKLLINETNLGFSGTCNHGINSAQHELILLLNSDVKLLPGYFDQQFKYFDRADTFGVMGRIIDMDSDHIQDAARMPKLNGLKLKTDYFYYPESANDDAYTYYLSGANALVDAKKLKQLGGFYELFSPFYCEDNELSLRAWRMGYKCYYEHAAVCRHQVSASTKNYQTAKWVKGIYFRNRFYMHALHYKGMAYWAWLMQISLIDLLPKILIGQTWIWGSYTSLFKNRKQIAGYKKQLEILLDEQGQSVFQIINTIKASIKDKAITRFKP
ncbi:glycosyltransferase family 2 protein [Mucilaginibacter pallidiroseus]|uniref:Glycosyltransferase family 2 protein n=1 Tax=Mucilaginibacter pallidiroseus TaxID=2599295 RepID=A0A563TXI9_9SPHI|nr:glycosyltransferase family 2 protein [Mucilaginibacter pallidiroseus]TWR24054.1 glycosyltransferase family 2 protein [Mucilaginibacter pallidiroseus]